MPWKTPPRPPPTGFVSVPASCEVPMIGYRPKAKLVRTSAKLAPHSSFRMGHPRSSVNLGIWCYQLARCAKPFPGGHPKSSSLPCPLHAPSHPQYQFPQFPLPRPTTRIAKNSSRIGFPRNPQIAPRTKRPGCATIRICPVGHPPASPSHPVLTVRGKPPPQSPSSPIAPKLASSPVTTPGKTLGTSPQK